MFTVHLYRLMSAVVCFFEPHLVIHSGVYITVNICYFFYVEVTN